VVVRAAMVALAAVVRVGKAVTAVAAVVKVAGMAAKVVKTRMAHKACHAVAPRVNIAAAHILYAMNDRFGKFGGAH
jgi:hypothetical protein